MSNVNTITPAVNLKDVKTFLARWWGDEKKDYNRLYMGEDFPEELLNIEEPLWWGESAPKAQVGLGNDVGAFRLSIRTRGDVYLWTNIFLVVIDDIHWEWFHCCNYHDWAKVLNKYLWPAERSPYDRPNFNRLSWAMPMLAFEIREIDGALKPHVAYSVKDKEVLEQFKYGVDPYERPMDPVYSLACWIHSKVLYTDLGNKCSGDIEDYEWTEENDEGNLESFFEAGEEYTGLPDDLAVLAAYAVLVMGDRHRASALLKIRAFVRPYDDPIPSYESCLHAAAHFWDY